VCAATDVRVYRTEIEEEERLEDFEAFFRRTFPPIARSLGLMVWNREEGIELAQEAFSRAFARWDRYESHDHARNSVLRIGVNLARSDARRRARMADQPMEATADVSASGVDVVERLAVLEALRELSTRQRTCVVLADYLGMESQEIAKILRIPAGTVRTHIARGREKLRTLLEENEGEP
jgi:RNA polymerase sigma-70 factor (ECF subfamily)